GMDARRASSRQDVASKRCPEHVSSAGDFRAAKVRHQGLFSLPTFFAGAKKVGPDRRGRELSVKSRLQKKSREAIQ
ncbi:hypothetical protein, partial [Hydrocarboniphaga sp.]|uniref:hypothetical protein n=1 Tax=Hydrocarboniphaga sp. TaxID=2033016 RepID=UPI002AB83262